MRLKLNRTLRAALIAAITAGGFTLSQAQADEAFTANVMQTGHCDSGTWSYTTTPWGDAAMTLTGTQMTATITTDKGGYCTTNNAYTNSFAPVKTNTGQGGVFDYTLTFTTDFGDNIPDVTLHSITVDFFSYTASGTPQDMNKPLQADMSLTAQGAGEPAASAHVKSNMPNSGNASQAVYTGDKDSGYRLASGVTPGVVTLTFGDGFALADNTTYVLTLAGVQRDGNIGGTLYGVGNVAFNCTTSVSTIKTYTWNGTSDNHSWGDNVWKDGEEAGQAFTSGSDAVFGDNEWKAVTVDASATARNISVEADGYKIAVDSGKTLAVNNTVEVTSGAALALDGAGSYTLGTVNLASGSSLAMTASGSIATLSGAGDLTVGANGHVTVTSLSSYTGNYNVTDGGELTVGFSISRDTLTVRNGTLNLGGSRHTIGTLTIGDGGLVTTTRHDGSGCVSGDIDIKAGGTFRVAGQHDAFGWGGNATKNIILTGESETKRAELQFQQTTGNSATFATNLKLMGHALVSTTKNGFNTYGGSIYAEGVDNTIQKFQLRSAATIEVAKDGELTVGDMEYGVETDHHLTKTGAGSLTFTGTAVMKKLNLLDGSLIINGGITTVNGADQGDANPASVLNKTINVQAGSLVLKGIFEIGGNTGEMETTYVGGETEGNGNGYEHVAGSSKVYTKAAEGASVNVEAATFRVGGEDVTLVDGVYTTTGYTTYDTFYVKGGAESLDHALTYAGEHTVSTVSLANATTINADRANATIGLALASSVSSATVNATAATTLSSISGWSDNKLTITGTDAVSLLPGQALTKQLTGTTALEVDTTVTTAKLYLYEVDASLTVGEHGVLNINASTGNNNNLTLRHGTAEVSGTVNIGHELDLSDGGKNVGATGELHILGTGSVIVGVGMWMYSTAGGVLLEEGGTLTITGKSVKFTGKEVGSIKVAEGKEMNYNVDNADALISNVTMEALGNITIANQLTNVDVVTGAHSVTLNSNAASVTVSDGGTFTKGASATVGTITVQDGGTIAGGVDATEVKINGESTATFEQGVSDVRGVDIFGVTNDVTIRNNVSEAKVYGGLEDDSMTVTGDLLASEVSLEKGPVVVKNELFVKSIAHEGTGALTLANVDVETLEGVYAYDGVLSLQNTTAVSLTEMSIAPEATVAVYQGTEDVAAQEGTVTITDTLTAGGGTLLANLTIVANEQGTTTWTLLGQHMTLGSEFTMDTTKGLVNLDITTLQALDALGLGESLVLVKALDETTPLAYGKEGGYTGTWFGQMFNRTDALQGDFQVFSTEQGFGLTKVSNTPEPTTGTLSLLALAALAARRRRK